MNNLIVVTYCDHHADENEPQKPYICMKDF